MKVLIVIWLGFPRKEGDKNDCYEVFSRMVHNGDFSENLEQLLLETDVILFSSSTNDLHIIPSNNDRTLNHTN